MPLLHLGRLRINQLLLLTLLILSLGSLAVVVQKVLADTGTGSVSLATAGSPVAENFDTLSNTAGSTTNTTLPTGWYITEQGGGARDNEQYAVDTGGSTTGDIYSYGTAAATDRALGALRSGTLFPFYGAKFTNNTGVTITALGISYTGEEWRLGNAGRTDRIDFQISTDATDLTTTGTYTDVDALDFTTPDTATTGAKNGNAAGDRTVITATISPLSIPNGASFFIRWTDFDASGADDGLSVDDFSITPNPTVPTNPSGTGAANPSTVPAGSSTLLTVTVTPGTNPTSTGITVTGNLSSIGGSSTQTFFDNNTNGDATAGDNVFSFQATVAGATPAGAKSLPITINDAQARTGSTSISLTTQAPATARFIHDVQGSGETPNFVGSAVIISGVVIGDYQGTPGLSGFFVQEEVSDWDSDPLTSEGIFVFDGSTPATAVNPGDNVTVTGTVVNFGGPPGMTELTSPGVVINSTGNSVPPTPVTFPLATSPAADLERFEGMLVNFTQNLYATDVGALGTFGEVAVSINSPLTIPTNTVDPNDNPASGNNISGSSNVAAVTTQQSLNDRSRLTIDDGSNKSNTSLTNTLTPIPFLIGSGTNATLRRGDFVANAVGVMNFGFGTYRIEPAPTITFTQGNPRPAAPAMVAGSNLRIASYNVENYFTTTGTGRGAANAAELTRQRAKIVAALEGLNADVIGLIELQKSGGNATASDLAAALTALGTVGSYASIADLVTLNGTDPDIKNGMIYRTSTVTLVGSSFTDTVAPIGDYSRDPLAQIFKLNATGRGFAVIVHHARSKSCPGSGLDDDLGDGQACFNDRRRNQSQEVSAFANNLKTNTVSDVLCIGDFNSYAQEDPIDVFRANGFTDLIDQYVPTSSKYSFTFNGETGQLDYAFATPSLASRALSATIWHIDADEPGIIDYTLTGKPDDRYAPTPYRASDHDPLLMSFNLAIPTAADGVVSGRITDPNGVPIGGAVVNLSGMQNRKFITDANGNYRFDNVETNGFYTVRPARANYSFSPAERSFSQTGNSTEAVFIGSRVAIGVNVIDTPEYFVRQNYLDFLGREPDESGFNFWSDQISSCGSDAGCRERRTINVSAAYFLSIEFQQTGGLVDGLYRASYGRRPYYNEFMPDTATVARDVVVGRANWAQTLEANKQAFVAAWMQRSDFRAAYDVLTNDAYVDSLISHAGAGFNGGDEVRAALVSGLNSGAITRAAVLRQIVENEGFASAKRNQMFVMMEYFGYLRRDPDASGYAFWLNKLNEFGGNFEQAEMVKAFLVSGEYRTRFAN